MFYQKKETPNLDNVFFKKNILKLNNIPKTLIISGGSRNGNHLIWSLLDGNKGIPFLPGEDKFLSQIFWRNLKSQRKFLADLKKKKSSFLRTMSGLKSNKWLRVFKDKINKNVWAGKHKPSIMPLLEFPKSKNKVNYPRYKNYLDINFTNEYDFFNIWYLYLRAFKLLTNNEKKKLKYQYIYAESGLRRELLFLAENDFDFICIAPVRKFETFYFSKIKSIFNSTQINKKFIKEAWEQWYHKTSDYLYLKKKYPKKFVLLPFEDFSNIKKRKKSIKKLFKILDLKFDKINLKPTHYKKQVLPNSSFNIKVRNFKKKIKEKDMKLVFPPKKIPSKYYEFYKKVEKKFY